ncbi:MAG: ribosome small subunit-dependent GTPase A [Acidobacteria bacterium]|nr:ribosome small subunit-dependent GTPase A [Acidobacteriota bacterium]MCB9377553.1 ribosome small subunit-dependent GTPase A [Holophagales bacterium]
MSENHEEKKARQKAAKIRASEKARAKPSRTRLDVEDWERWELDALPQRQQRAERRTEPLGKIVDRLRAESAEAAAESKVDERLAGEGLVVSITRGQCEVELEGASLVCHVPKALALTQQTDLAVGDRVTVSRRPGGALAVSSILPRTSRLSRPDPFLAHRERVIAANLDLAIVVVSLRKPPLSPGLIDRFLVALAHGGVAAAIAVNKVDLADEPREEDPELELLAPYRDLETPLVPCSGKTGEGIAELAALLAGRTAVLVGHSGVGKSSLLAALAPEIDVRVGEVSEHWGKGRHTTTRSRIYDLGGGTRLIDTPGIREFGLWKLEPAELALYFDEFEEPAASCRFNDCTHSHEPACAVRAAAESGAIPPERYAAYLRILESLQAG